VLALEARIPAQVIDRPLLRRGHEPGPRIVRDPRLRPPLERCQERVLRQILRDADVAHDPREAGDQPGRLDPPDRIDRAMCIRSRHGIQLGRRARLLQGHGDD
jgi:hypothetical protein